MKYEKLIFQDRPQIFHFAETDEWVSAASLQKLRKNLLAKGREATYYEYPATTHWFFESDRLHAFDQKAAALTWK